MTTMKSYSFLRGFVGRKFKQAVWNAGKKK